MDGFRMEFYQMIVREGNMSKASTFLKLYEMNEALGLDLLKANLAAQLKRVQFTPVEIQKIVQEAPEFIAGKEGWTDFLKNADLKDLARSKAGLHTKKMKSLSYYMARLKHNV
jgi:hypothetical protein